MLIFAIWQECELGMFLSVVHTFVPVPRTDYRHYTVSIWAQCTQNSTHISLSECFFFFEFFNILKLQTMMCFPYLFITLIHLTEDRATTVELQLTDHIFFLANKIDLKKKIYIFFYNRCVCMAFAFNTNQTKSIPHYDANDEITIKFQPLVENMNANHTCRFDILDVSVSQLNWKLTISTLTRVGYISIVTARGINCIQRHSTEAVQFDSYLFKQLNFVPSCPGFSPNSYY